MRHLGRGSGTAVAQVLASAVLFGTTGTAQALGPDTTTPLGVGAVRLIVGGAVLLVALRRVSAAVPAAPPTAGGAILVRSAGQADPFPHARARTDVAPVRHAVALWATGAGLVAGLGAAAYQLAFFAAVDRTGVAVGTLVTIGTGPVVVGLLSWRLHGDAVTRSWMVATLACVAGLVLLSAADLGAADPQPLGLALALTAGVAYGSYTVAAKSMMRRGVAPDTAMAATFGLGGLILVPALFVAPMGWTLEPSGVALVLWLGPVTIALGYVLFGRGLSVLAAGPVATLVLVEPLVATLLGVTVLDEGFGPAAVAGAALVVAGVGLQARAATRPHP